MTLMMAVDRINPHCIVSTDQAAAKTGTGTKIRQDNNDAVATFVHSYCCGMIVSIGRKKQREKRIKRDFRRVPFIHYYGRSNQHLWGS
jgi:hypothetical protein